MLSGTGKAFRKGMAASNPVDRCRFVLVVIGVTVCGWVSGFVSPSHREGRKKEEEGINQSIIQSTCKVKYQKPHVRRRRRRRRTRREKSRTQRERET